LLEGRQQCAWKSEKDEERQENPRHFEKCVFQSEGRRK
jgi:hypothetical protein